jgi:hypothetical protein
LCGRDLGQLLGARGNTAGNIRQAAADEPRGSASSVEPIHAAPAVVEDQQCRNGLLLVVRGGRLERWGELARRRAGSESARFGEKEHFAAWATAPDGLPPSCCRCAPASRSPTAPMWVESHSSASWLCCSPPTRSHRAHGPARSCATTSSRSAVRAGWHFQSVPEPPRPIDDVKISLRRRPADVMQWRLEAAADDAANERVARPLIQAMLAAGTGALSRRDQRLRGTRSRGADCEAIVGRRGAVGLSQPAGTLWGRAPRQSAASSDDVSQPGRRCWTPGKRAKSRS